MALQALKTQLHQRYGDIKENLSLIFGEEGELARQRKILLALGASYACESHELTHFLEELCAHELKMENYEDVKALISMLELKTNYNEAISLLKDESIFKKESGFVQTVFDEPSLDKETYYLISLAVALINHSEVSVAKTKKNFLNAGGNPEEIVEAVKIISVIKGAAKAFELENKGLGFS